MAYRTVETPEDNDQVTFKKKSEVWAKVGDELAGIFQKIEECSNPEYGWDYFFKDREGATFKISLKGQLHKDLQKCAIQPGELVKILKKGEKDIGKANPMPLFKITVSDPPKGAAPVAPPKPAADGW